MNGDNDDTRAMIQSDHYDPRQDDPTDTTPDEDEEAALQREMMEEAGQRRPDGIDWMRDGDQRHYHDD
jgi:8-oxo-dGTP pyrophosphatase MutT (NUDIX family)